MGADPGGGAAGEVGPGDGSAGPQTTVVYLAIALRNAGNGIAVLQGWRFFPEAHRDVEHAPLEEFQRQTRDLYIPVGDVGFWQGAFRDTTAPGYQEARQAIEGGQRAISRFFALPVEHQILLPPGDHHDQGRTTGPGWLASASRHWSLDRPDGR